MSYVSHDIQQFFIHWINKKSIFIILLFILTVGAAVGAFIAVVAVVAMVNGLVIFKKRRYSSLDKIIKKSF